MSQSYFHRVKTLSCASLLLAAFILPLVVSAAPQKKLAIGSGGSCYGYAQGYYYGYGQGYYYGYGQGYYYGYGQGYYYGYSQSSYANTWEDTAPACGASTTFYSASGRSGASRAQKCR